MIFALMMAAAIVGGTPATVRSGVDHWRAGEDAAAVAAWLPYAAQGDADALFNLGQAYKLGRGVTKDASIARDYYRKAAAKGHLPAQANLGIALFQAGDKAEAVRWLKTAADRGEPRAQYVLGIAAYNGDGTAKNLGLAYGYLLRAQASGLAQANSALGSIEPTLTSEARSAGESLAAALASGSAAPALAAGPAPRPTTPRPPIVATVGTAIKTAPKPEPSIAAVNLPASVGTPATKVAAPVPKPAAAPAPEPAPITTAAPPPGPAPVVATVAIPGAAKLANAETPTAKPPVAKPAAAQSDTAQKPTRPGRPDPGDAAQPVAMAKPEPPRPSGWRVQLGAFSSKKLAEAAWAKVADDAPGKAKPIYEAAGPVTKLQLGPYATREAARDACAKLAFAGKACFVTGGPA